jgi:hypothetical protein
MSAEIFQFSTAPRRSVKIKTSTRVGEDIGDNLPAEVVLGRCGRPLPEPLTDTCKNQRLRDARKSRVERRAPHRRLLARADEVARRASCAQTWHVADTNTHAKSDHKERWMLVDLWRAALVKRLLTPAPDVGAVTWKWAQLAGEQYKHVGVKRERIELAIAADAEWLAAHPTRRSIAASRQSAEPEAEQ